MATTFKDGDPGYSGPLAGVPLNLHSYHILELKDHIPAEVWEREMGLYELEIEEETQNQIKETLAQIRD